MVDEFGEVAVTADEIVVRITATPTDDNDGSQLADEVLAALSEATANTQAHS